MNGISETQRLLLRAVIGRDESAVRDWREWDALTDFEDLDADSQWLLPALYRNLQGLGVLEKRLSRYHNVYRHNWYRNHLALHRASAEIGGSRRRERVLLLGGAAMATAHYETIGERPFERVEALIPGDDGQGLDAIRVRRALHGPRADEALISRSAPLRWRSLRANSLDPVDQLVEICAGRERWDARSALLWLVDIAAVLRRDPAIQWSQLVARAETLSLGEKIEAARAEFGPMAAAGLTG